MSDTVVISTSHTEVVEVTTAAVEIVEVNLGVQGPQGANGADGADGAPGPQGPQGSITTRFDVTTPNDTWTIQHNLGRVPSVTVYIGGQQVLANVDANDTIASITFASPQTGFAILA